MKNKKKSLKSQFVAEYSALKNAIDRCTRENHPQYKDYGGRGVTVDPSWSDRTTGFEAFFKEMGPKPTPAHTLDRIDNSRGYTQSNARWEGDWSVQMRNRRKPNKQSKDFGWGTGVFKNSRYTQTYPLVPFGDQLITLREAAQRLNLKLPTLRQRFERGMSPHEALTPTLYSPVGKPRQNPTIN